MVQTEASKGVIQGRDTSNDSNLVDLLKSDTVQKDLGLTADQIRQHRSFIDLSEEARREFRAGFDELRNSKIKDSETKERDFQKLSEDFDRKSKELRAKVLTDLTPGQYHRLKQIELQKSILDTLNRPDIMALPGFKWV